MRIEIGDKKYNVEVAQTDEEKTKGLQGKKELAEDEGMLFIYDEPQTVGFWMQDTDRTLADADVEAAMAAVVDFLAARFGARLRA